MHSYLFHILSLITFAKSIDSDKAPQIVRPDLDPIGLTLMVFLKEFFEKVDFEKISRRQKSLKNFPEGKRLSYEGFPVSTIYY